MEIVLMTVQLSAPHRPLINWTQLLTLALLVIGTLLVVGLYMATLQAGVTSTSAATASEAPVSQRLTPPAETPRSDCAVTGDLAGDGNPAEIAAILCGRER